MISRIHSKLGTAGFIISILALVVALGGGAYAASGGLTGKQKKEVTKIAQTEAKKFAGKTGATGPAGANGTNGAKGDTGTTGAEGKQGAEGKEGEPGEPGSPWTVGGVLPKGATETGVWSMNSKAHNIEVYAGISFPIPLKAALGVQKVNYVATTSTVCTGSVQQPTAPEGVLCVYQAEAVNTPGPISIYNTTGLNSGAGTAGAFIYFEEVGENSRAFGTWAVTGS